MVDGDDRLRDDVQCVAGEERVVTADYAAGKRILDWQQAELDLATLHGARDVDELAHRDGLGAIGPQLSDSLLAEGAELSLKGDAGHAWRLFSFPPQRPRRIDATRPPRRRVSREDGDTEKERGHHPQRRRVARRNAEDEALQPARGEARSDDSPDDTRHGWCQRLADDAEPDRALRLAERQANSDLARAAAHRVRDDAVDADDRQHERERTERPHQRAAEALRRSRVAEAVLERRQLGERKRRVEPAHRGAYRRDE